MYNNISELQDSFARDGKQRSKFGLHSDAKWCEAESELYHGALRILCNKSKAEIAAAATGGSNISGATPIVVNGFLLQQAFPLDCIISAPFILAPIGNTGFGCPCAPFIVLYLTNILNRFFGNMAISISH